jgi:hypothetical protein
MAAGSGKVALVKSAAVLTGACPNDSNIIDFLGYGSTLADPLDPSSPRGSGMRRVQDGFFLKLSYLFHM